ncbi:MAG: hypothetical protein RSD87_07340, partial [Cellulosilyticaceae bacterium]
LYSYWLSRPAYAVAKFNNNRKNKIHKISSRAHGYDLYLYRNNLSYLPFREFVFNNLDEINFISEDGLEYFEKTFVPTLKISEKLQKKLSRLGTYNLNKEKKNIKDKNKICIASCSRVIELKRLDLIILDSQKFSKIK